MPPTPSVVLPCPHEVHYLGSSLFLTAWFCLVSSLRVFLLSSAWIRIWSPFSCSTAASYSWPHTHTPSLFLPHSFFTIIMPWHHMNNFHYSSNTLNHNNDEKKCSPIIKKKVAWHLQDLQQDTNFTFILLWCSICTVCSCMRANSSASFAWPAVQNTTSVNSHSLYLAFLLNIPTCGQLSCTKNSLYFI